MKGSRNLLIAALTSALVTVNLIAFMQARAMTRFVEGGDRTASPERLGLLDKVSVLVSGVHIPRPRNFLTPAKYDLPFIAQRIPSAEKAVLDGWLIPASDSRPVILMFHGYAVGKATLLSTARVFHELGHATLLVDFYGSGESSGTGTSIGVREAHDVAATVAFARKNWPGRKIILYGISMGGAAVLRAVAAHGVDADGLIIEATFDSLLKTGKNRFRVMGLPGSPFAETLLFWGSVLERFNYFTHDPADYAHAVKVPALVLHGEKDARVSVPEAQRIAAAMGPHGKLVIFPGVPHMAIVDAEREKWQNEVSNFLTQF